MKALFRLAAYAGSKFALKLWGAMMLLVAFGVAFLWIVQIAFFEPRYIQTTTELLKERIAPVVDGFNDADSREMLSELSKTTGGRVFVVSPDGKILIMYSLGMVANPTDERLEGQSLFWERAYRHVIDGETVKSVIDKGQPSMKVAMGFPVRYRGEPAALFLYNSLSELYTMQALTRRELFLLSLVLTAAASLLAMLLAWHFTRPILDVKKTVDRLAAGDLNASPNILRNDELGSLAGSVKELGVALRRVDLLRREVISNVSHELRSPLAVVRGYGEMLRDITWKDEHTRNANLNLIIDEAERLSRMVDDILDHSQFQAGYGKLKRLRCNLVDVVSSEVAFFAPGAKKHGLSIRFESFSSDVPAELDASRIAQVLRNLLSNAINHTVEGNEIVVYIEKHDRGVRVAVINPGPEIPAEARRTIWERYRRVQHQGGRSEGTGIGLSIVASILDAHGFPYGVDCEDGKNIFWFDVPDA